MSHNTLNSLLVLLVEPSTAQQKIISGYLSELGVVQIQFSQKGDEALEKLASSKPDLLISAMHLEDMTGTDLALKVRIGDNNRDVPFMLISSETHYRYLEPIRQAGVIATLPKPFKKEQLKKALYATLDYIDPLELELEDMAKEDFKVLLVDDSHMSRRHIRHIFESMGLEQITEVENGVEALEMINDSFYDLIVTDFYMPEMDGKELVEHIRTDSPQSSVPILMVSSEHDESRLAGVRQAGVSAILDKPFETSSIKRLVERIVHQ
ncbi:MAG: response regulator [Gammaproteobacteria bacterium]|nr:response regulator [Gammaproteobacteria bacterium]